MRTTEKRGLRISEILIVSGRSPCLRVSVVFVVVAALFFGGGCLAPPVTGGVTEGFAQYCPAAGAPVVVLPFANETADMDAPGVVREAFIAGLGGRGVNMMPVEVTDEKLREEGITQGGQLKLVDPQTLKEILGVDYVFYGNVDTFSSKNLGFYTSRTVKAKFRLVHTPTGEVLWEGSGEEAEREWHDIRDKKAVTRGLVSGLLQSALKGEAAEAVEKALSTLPAFDGPASPAEPGAPPEVPLPQMPVMPIDPDAAFRRLVAAAGIEFADGFLKSKILLPPPRGPSETTVRMFLTGLQMSSELGGGRLKLTNWRRIGNIYKVRLESEGGRGDLVFTYRPLRRQTLVQGADPDTGRISPALNPMIMGVTEGAGADE